MKKSGILVLLMLVNIAVSAKDYNASLFGIQSNGVTNNTASIQKAIDYISEHGGGTLVFYVGRYLTGTVRLKSNVYIRLEEGAVLAGTSSPYDYNITEEASAMVVADGQSNIGILGKGVLEGSGEVLKTNEAQLEKAGYLKKTAEPGLIAFSNCTFVSLNGLNLWNNSYMALALTHCKNVKIEEIDIDGKHVSSSSGIYLRGCKWINIEHVFIRVMQKPLVTTGNEHLDIQNSMTDSGTSLSTGLK